MQASVTSTAKPGCLNLIASFRSDKQFNEKERKSFGGSHNLAFQRDQSSQRTSWNKRPFHNGLINLSTNFNLSDKWVFEIISSSYVLELAWNVSRWFHQFSRPRDSQKSEHIPLSKHQPETGVIKPVVSCGVPLGCTQSFSSSPRNGTIWVKNQTSKH